MNMDALITHLEEGAGSDVDRVLAATKDAYSRRAYGEKAWKAAAEFLVKEYGAADAAKIMHHKAMRWAHDQAKKRDVNGIVASVKSTVGSWPAKEIIAEIGDSVELDEGIGDAIKSVYNRFKEGFKKGLASRDSGKRFKGKPDYWRSVRGQNIGFTGSEGSGKPVIGPKEIVSRMKSKVESMEEAVDKERQMQIAKTIGSQLGGIGAIKMMTGAKKFNVLPEQGDYLGGLDIQFPLPKHKGAVNYFKVLLAGNDTYTVEVGVERGGARKVKDTIDNVYAEDLIDLFEKQTGLYLRFGR